MTSEASSNDPVRIRYQVVGSVQGMGFRPFVWRLATSLGLSGSVRNTASTVEVDVQGRRENVEEFGRRLRVDLPCGASIERMTWDSRTPSESVSGFVISASEEGATSSVPHLLPDLAICCDCLRELRDGNNRRYRYPFINCTACGPRYTIIQDVPYDRGRTTMDSFRMCDPCREEYRDPKSRRFHAQPIACSSCGPKVWYSGGDHGTGEADPTNNDEAGEDAIQRFHREICGGKIIAVKGIGGFHLVCDPVNEGTVRRLREWKTRSQKPFAIMVSDLETARTLAVIDSVECEALANSDAPIVLVRKRSDVGPEKEQMFDRVAPQSNHLGLMLPYSALHVLMLEQHGLLIVTSANLCDEPIVNHNGDALSRLATIADGFLFHDRRIQSACDDSVVQFVDGERSPRRSGRGMSPKVIPLESDGKCLLALGGDLKSSFCFVSGDRAWMSPHIGDLATPAAIDRLCCEVEHFESVLRLRPEAVVADQHPGYHSHQFADEYAKRRGIPFVQIQHHEAHAAALMAEHGDDQLRSGMIACCFDGTGYAPDGVIRGGEWFSMNEDGPMHFAQLQPVSLPGGDGCAKKPSRSCLAYLHHCGLEWSDDLPPVVTTSSEERRVLSQQLDGRIQCVPSSSAGRLFDAVSSLLGICQVNTYEGEAAMRLEHVAEGAVSPLDFTRNLYSVHANRDDSGDAGSHAPWTVDFAPMFRWLIQNLAAKRNDVSVCAAAVHHVVSDVLVEICLLARDRFGHERVGLTGGVFQNRILTRRTRASLEAHGIEVWTHSSVPANDGGLALGQAVLARKLLARKLLD